MENQGQLDILAKGVHAWNKWRQERPGIRPRLPGATLHGYWGGADLHSAILNSGNMRGAQLGDADLSGAGLKGADFSGASLFRASLRGADLRGASFVNTNLIKSDLRDTNLTLAQFIDASLRGADLEGAWIARTLFGNVDLFATKGLGLIHHMGPSIIGIDTIYRSQGQIPESFLRSAGVPDNFVTYVRSLMLQPIDFYSCFISYCSQNQDFAERLYADLQAKHVRCWFAPEDLKIGDRFQERIEESIRVFDKVMIVLSEASVESDWVRREVDAAMERESHEKRTVLFPISIDDAVMDAPQPWAADIRRTRHIGDFRCWKNHDAYVNGLERLLRDLKASEEARR